MRAIHPHRRASVAAGHVIVVALLSVIAVSLWGGSARASTSSSGMSLSSLVNTPTGSAAPTPPGSGAPLADQIEAVALENQFANTFAGTQLNPDGTVTIYTTSAGVAPLSTALTAALGSAANAQWSIAVVPYSAQQLESETLTIANSGQIQGFTNLNTAPFGVVSWGPDPTSGTIQFTVIGDPTSAAARLQTLFPDIPISAVASTSLTMPQLAENRYYDSPAYSNGDRIDTSTGNGCTEGFAIVGKRSGNIFGVTAGHCGGDIITQDGVGVGGVSTNYRTNNGPDFETYTCDCQGRVWYEGPSIGHANGITHSTNNGYCACEKGQLVSFDGATTGEMTDFTVENTNALCVPFGSVTTCGLNDAKQNGVTVQPGDSGGPVYQRSDFNSVYATGTIVGYDSGGDNYYQRISVILNDSDGTILPGF